MTCGSRKGPTPADCGWPENRHRAFLLCKKGQGGLSPLHSACFEPLFGPLLFLDTWCVVLVLAGTGVCLAMPLTNAATGTRRQACPIIRSFVLCIQVLSTLLLQGSYTCYKLQCVCDRLRRLLESRPRSVTAQTDSEMSASLSITVYILHGSIYKTSSSFMLYVCKLR